MTEDSIDLRDLRDEVYLDGKDDYFGLYEIIWSLNAKYPDVSKAAKVAAAQTVLQDLLREGSITLFTTVWPPSDYTPVPPELALDAIAGASAWDDPGGGPYLCYTTTT